MKIRDLKEHITSNIISVSPESSIEKVYQTISENKNTRVVCVVDDEKKLLGIIDINALIHIYGAKYTTDVLTEFSNLLAKKAEDFMTSPISVKLDDSFKKGIKLMLETKIHDLPITDENHKIVGNLNCFDVLNALKKQA